MDAPIVGQVLSTAPENIGLALLVVPFLDWAKKSPLFGWVNDQTAPIISAAIAFFGAIGIHFAFDPTQGQLLITGLTFAGIVHGLIEWGKQWAANHWLYKVQQLVEAQKTIATAAQTLPAIPPTPLKPAA